MLRRRAPYGNPWNSRKIVRDNVGHIKARYILM